MFGNVCGMCVYRVGSEQADEEREKEREEENQKEDGMEQDE